MPHIVVEYSPNLEERVDVPSMLTAMHEALDAQGIDKARIKTRATTVNHSVVGNAPANVGQMVHITLLLLEGRDEATKQQYANPIHAVAKEIVQKDFPECAVTLEVRDMVTATYIL